MLATRTLLTFALAFGSTCSAAFGYAAPRPAAQVAADTKVAAPAVRHPLATVAFVGASVSAGFGNSQEFAVGKNVPLGEFFEQLVGPELPTPNVHDFGSSRFFIEPTEEGRKQIQRALKTEPSMVVGIDFLFWYAFGRPRRSSPRRMGGLQEGLRLLEQIRVPLIIGDLPNVNHALNGSTSWRGGAPIIRRSQLPTEAERHAMNKVIHEWAGKRANVRVLPLARLIAEMLAGKTMQLHGNQWTVSEIRQALQADLLHPKAKGMSWVALHVANTATGFPEVGIEDFHWEETALQKKLNVALAPSRKKQAEREAKRAKRRAERDARKAAAGK